MGIQDQLKERTARDLRFLIRSVETLMEGSNGTEAITLCNFLNFLKEWKAKLGYWDDVPALPVDKKEKKNVPCVGYSSQDSSHDFRGIS